MNLEISRAMRNRCVELHVDPAAAPGGDGSIGAPFGSLTKRHRGARSDSGD